jgi:formate dehydrogenase major subunit
VLYNRASADPRGRPWSERKRYVWWDADEAKWTGYDVPDFPADKPPHYRAPGDAEGMDAISGTDPFIMMADGRGWLYSPSGLLDGPFPTHYEPIESPVPNPLYPEPGANPAALRWSRPDNPYNPVGDPRYPLVATTFRLTEQHTAGGMSRGVPWLSELQPEMFAEIDPLLARERGIEDGGWMTIFTERAEIEARAKVTERMRPLSIDGRPVHQVALPWHFGYALLAQGDSANDLGALAADPNVSIQESKAFTCDVRAGRRRGQTSERIAGRRAPTAGHDASADHPVENPAEHPELRGSS